MIEGMLLKAGWRIALFTAAILGVICTPIAIAQTIRIDGLWLFGSGLNGKIDSLYASINNPVDGFVVKLDRAGGNLSRCEAATKRQNSAVDEWKATAARWEALADKALDRAKSQAGEYRARANAQLASPTVGDACLSAFNRNRENAK